jgi:hypothetical protein
LSSSSCRADLTLFPEHLLFVGMFSDDPILCTSLSRCCSNTSYLIKGLLRSHFRHKRSFAAIAEGMNLFAAGHLHFLAGRVFVDE